jgi:hypothetical protein
MFKYGKKLILVGVFLYSSINTFAQHDHQMQMDSVGTGSIDSTDMPPMSHAFSLNLPMNRNGSGTGWLPDSTPMYGYMMHSKKWMFMAHGNVFIRYNSQDIFQTGSRGDQKVDAVNWFMFMGQRAIGKKGLFRFNTMMSLDALFGGNGYPLLFQTGESWNSGPLVDRQHPHDLFSELSIAYTYSINKRTDVFVYTGYPGEPALGSVAFMHRVSALYNPDAPISHHWNDGTHITFGVLTGGIRLGKFKVDASIFTGREPDENRYDFDKPRFDSYSGRLSFNPNAYWSFQVSEGFAKSPEITHPEEDVYHTTASAVYSRPLHPGNFINATALWGMNTSHANENTALLEAALVLKRWAIYGRYEWVEKSREELDLSEEVYGETAIFPINALTLGVSYDVIRSKILNMAIGAQGSYFAADDRLNGLYGKNPAAAEAYIRIYPPRMIMRKM